MSPHVVHRPIRIAGALTLALAVAAPAGTGSSAPSAEPRSVTDVCEPLADPVDVTSIEQFDNFLVGTWIRCHGNAMWDYFPPDEIGLQFTADGTFYRIHEADDGTLIRAEGLWHQGDWRTYLDSFGRQLDTRLLGSGTKMHHPELFRSPDAFTLGPLMWYYQRWNGPEPVPGLPPSVDTGGCGHLTEPVIATSEDEVRDLLTGTWTLCEGVGAEGPIAIGSEVGLVITDDGRFERLVRHPDGTVEPGAEPAAHGTTAEIYRSIDRDVAGAFGVGLTTSDGWTFGGAPIFFASPPSMYLAGLPGSGYLRGEPPAAAQSPAPTVPTSGLPATGSAPPVIMTIIAVLTTTTGIGLVLIARGAGRRQTQRR